MHSPTLTPLLTLTLALLTLPAPIHAWGSLGHRTTTAVALHYFPPHHPVQHLLTTLLHTQDPTTASLFPDRIRYIPSYAYTAPWHYIDSHAVPPQTCTVELPRDCPTSDGGCVVTAIANHTARVADTSLPLWERGQSLRFMLHFFGDVHMPLHTVGWERGGNEVPVLFDGVHTNLHSVWDTLVPKKIVALAGDGIAIHHTDGDVSVQWDPTNETSTAYAWSAFLHARYASDPALSEDTPDGRPCTHDATECALSWAREANKWVCRYVLADGVDGVSGRDLGGSYFDGAVPIVEELVFKGGRRLARWLEVVAGVDGWVVGGDEGRQVEMGMMGWDGEL